MENLEKIKQSLASDIDLAQQAQAIEYSLNGLRLSVDFFYFKLVNEEEFSLDELEKVKDIVDAVEALQLKLNMTIYASYINAFRDAGINPWILTTSNSTESSLCTKQQ